MPARQQTVLLVDDSTRIRQMLCQAFQSAEFSICGQAEDGAEAIVLARIHRPDLIVLDLSMPVMNGIDAARELRYILPNVTIILFTMYANIVSAKEAIEAGISSVIDKSDVEALISEARSHVERRDSRKAAVGG